MSHLEEEMQRRARMCLSKCWDNDAPLEPSLERAFSCGWRGGLGEGISYTDADYVSTTALMPISYEMAEAMCNELAALGLKPASGSRSPLAGEFSATMLAPTFDGKHVEGFTLTVPQATFIDVLKPQLDTWLEAKGRTA